MIRITRFCSLSNSSEWYWGNELLQTSQLYSKIERIRAEYILMRLAGRILLRRKILRTYKRLEPSRLWIEYVRPNFRLF